VAQRRTEQEIMKRREFLQDLATAGALGRLAPGAAAFQGETPSAPDPRIRQVLVAFKCHLDVGFVDTEANVIRKYFEVHFPQAIRTASTLRQSGGDRYVWTTGSWLLLEYLEKASAAVRKTMEQAIAAGDIAWHALPFTWQTELMDRSMIAASVGLSKSLDRRFGRATTGAKMTDVPGHTRAIIGPLAEQGVKLLDIGVNSASTPPDVPALFVWKDPEGRGLVTMYHHREYGGVVKVPGSGIALDLEVANDNAGPHSAEEIHAIYARLRKQFPNAKISACDLTAMANAIEPYRAGLPVVTQEIGDTWIYGAGSDPLKVARYREVARLRSEWIARGRFRQGDATDLALLRRLLLEVEHTWGTDTKTWLDFDHYRPRDLAPMLGTPKYKVVLASWEEKRRELFDAIAALPAPLRAEAERRVRTLEPAPPAVMGMERLAAGETIEAKHFSVALDRTGAISRLRARKGGRDWASAERPLARFSYQTLSKSDYDRFFQAYLKSQADWAPKDFGKPKIESFGAVSRTWTPVVAESWRARDAAGQRILARLEIRDAGAEKSGAVAWPQTMYLSVSLPDAEPAVDIAFSWFGKKANRMPEALWLTFQPLTGDARGWTLDKSGSRFSPFEVVTGGNRVMHCVIEGLRYSDARGALAIQTLDAPLVALGEMSPVHFSREQPDLSKGIHFNLFNNGWGTNYVQWFGENMRFRFRLTA
jgi:hypothetical protein